MFVTVDPKVWKAAAIETEMFERIFTQRCQNKNALFNIEQKVV